MKKGKITLVVENHSLMYDLREYKYDPLYNVFDQWKVVFVNYA